MTSRQKEIYLSYIYNTREYLKDDLIQLQTNIRYRKIDVIDCLELALAIERLNTFDNTVKALNDILKIGVAK